MIIPHTSISQVALRAVVEEFVSREGTDYGFEVSLEEKVAAVIGQLEKGSICLFFDPESETCDLVVVGSTRYRHLVASSEHQ